MARTENTLEAANALLCVVSIASGGARGAVATAVEGAKSLNHIRNVMGRSVPQVADKLAKDLTTALADPHLRLPPDRHILIPQMIVAADSGPADLMAARLDADPLSTLMLARVTDVEHRAAPMQDAFRLVVTPLLRKMLADPALTPALMPAFMQAAGQSLGAVREGVEALKGQMARVMSMLEAMPTKTAEARASGITDHVLIDLA
jgi:hypothetical protein